jgi:hypothetical protein
MVSEEKILTREYRRLDFYETVRVFVSCAQQIPALAATAGAAVPTGFRKTYYVV